MKKIIKKMRKSKSGFSLLEILLAVVLLAIVVTPLIQTIYTSMALNKKSRIQMGATDVGQSALEYFESLTYPDIKDLLENDGNTVNIPAINYAGKAKAEGGSWYGSSSSDPVTMAQRKNTWALFTELTAYTRVVAMLDDKYISYKADDDYDFYAINKVKSNGFDYDLVVFITPLYEGSDYSVYEIQIDVYYNDYNNPNNIHCGHDRNNLMCSYKGSVFNKFD